MKQIIYKTIDKKEFDNLKQWSEYQDSKSIKNMDNILKKLSELEAFTYNVSESN